MTPRHQRRSLSTPRILLALPLLLLLADVSTLWAAGSISGQVTYRGEIPAAETHEITQDTGVCGTEAARQAVTVDDAGGLRWAVVQMSGGGKVKEGAAVTDMVQEGCDFAPRVVVARPGAEMGVLNEDGILHNFHTYSEKNAVVNLAQPGFVKRLPLTFAEPERIRVTCDVHAWMEGWVVVSDERLASVTDETGGFAFTDVPAGEHEIRVWHETLGEQTATVVVEEGQEATVSIEFGS